MSKSNARDLIFISYATGDAADLARWLDVKLTLLGFDVWRDQSRLKGGVPFVNEFETAIKDRSFRVLALMSPDAISRPNPKRERSLASTTRDRLEIPDFLIPIRAHREFNSSDLDFYTNDHQWIDFTRDWALGLKQLVATLSEAGAPRPLKGTEGLFDQLADVHAEAEHRDEKLWGNLLPIAHLPKKIYRYRLLDKYQFPKGSHTWAAWKIFGTDDVLAFRPPPLNAGIDVEELESFAWMESETYNGIVCKNVAKSLIKKEIEFDCIGRRMKWTPDGRRLFFPRRILEKEKLFYIGHDGKTWIKPVSDRKYSAAKDGRCLGHLSCSFTVDLNDLQDPSIRINLGVHITFTDETPVPPSRIPGRRKSFCQTWYNMAWLQRTEAVAFWLSDGKERAYFTHKGESLSLAGQLRSFSVNKGIFEEKLGQMQSEVEMIDDETGCIVPSVREGEIDGSSSL